MPTATKAREPETAENGVADDWPEEPPTIHVLMGRILAELPAIGKNQRNKEQGFMFRGYDDVMDALNPLLGKYGVFVVPDVVERVVSTRQTSKGGTMYEVNLHVRFRFYGPEGDYVEASGWGEGTDMGDKATNKAMTGAFKYVLFQTFAVATEETAATDADGSTPEPTDRSNAAPAPSAASLFDEALGKLGTWVADPTAWAAEAREALLGDKTNLTAEDKRDLLDRLIATIANLDTVYASSNIGGWGLDLSPDGPGRAELQKAVRTAFSTAFGVDVKGPEPFEPGVPF